MTHVRRVLITLVLISTGVGHAVEVDAGTSPAKCTLFTKGDAERVLRARVVPVETPLDQTLCAWGLAKDPGAGVVVARSEPPMYPPHADTPSVSRIRHVKGVGQDAYTYYANAGAGGVYTADVMTAKGVTSVTLAERAGNADTALAIARMVMNR